MTHFAMEYLERAEKLLTRAYEDIEALRRENAELRKDAERYQWVRKAGAFDSQIGLDLLSENPEKYDAAVDASIAYTAAVKQALETAKVTL